MAKGDGGGHAAVFDHESLQPEKIDAEVVGRFDGLDARRATG